MNMPKVAKRSRKQSTLNSFLNRQPHHSQSKEPGAITKQPSGSSTESGPINNNQLETVVGENASNQFVCSSTSHISESEHGMSAVDISRVFTSEHMLSDSDEVNFLENCWKPVLFDFLDSRVFPHNKLVAFQAKWLEKHRWLAYSAHKDYKGGWCLECILFLTDSEKESLGAFVMTPFNNYKKSKELRKQLLAYLKINKEYGTYILEIGTIQLTVCILHFLGTGQPMHFLANRNQ